MPLWALLGLVGVGGYLLLSQSSSSSPSASSTLPPPSLGSWGGGTPPPTATPTNQPFPYATGLRSDDPGISPDLLSYYTQAEAQAANPGKPIVQASDGSGLWGVDGVFNVVHGPLTASGYVGGGGTVGSSYWTPARLAELAHLRATVPAGWTVYPWHNRIVFHGPLGQSHYAVTWNEARRYAHHIRSEDVVRFVDPMSGAAY